MKKHLLTLILVALSLWGYSQCPSPDYTTSGIVMGLNSSTHPFQVGGNYTSNVYQSTVPLGTGTQYMGQWMNNFRVQFTSGSVSNTFDWYAGSGSTRGKYKLHLIRTSTGQAATITTNLGSLSTNGTSSTNNIVIDSDTQISFDLPANPYTDKDLFFALELTHIRIADADCAGGFYYFPVSYPIANPSGSGIGFGSLVLPTFTEIRSTPWIDLKLPARLNTELVNAGTAVYMAAGAPLGTGVTMPIPYPASITAGNLLLMVSTTRVSGSVPVGPPAGWSTFASYPFGIYIYSKIATGSESGNINLIWTATTTNNRNGRIYQFKNALPTAYSVNTDNSTTTATCASMTNTNIGNLAVSFIYSSSSAVTNTYSGGALTWSEPISDFRGLGMNIATYPTAGLASGTATQAVQNNKTLNFVLKLQ